MFSTHMRTNIAILSLAIASGAATAAPGDASALAQEVVTVSHIAADAIEGVKLGAVAGLKEGRYTPSSFKCFIDRLPDEKVEQVAADVLVARFEPEQLQMASTFYRSQAGQLVVKMSHRTFLIAVGAPAPEFRDVVTDAHIESIKGFKATEVGTELMELTSPTMLDVARSINAVLLQHLDTCRDRKSQPST